MRMKRFRRTIAVLIPVIVIYGFFLFLRASDDPKFCASCHYMQQYYNNWLNSSHNQVSCGKCHYAPGIGNYITGKLRLASEILRYYMGAYSTEVTSRINDGACLQCHKKEDFYFKDIRFDKNKISFNHADHLSAGKMGFSVKCQTCHSQLVQGEHGGVSTQICILCHFSGSDMKGGPVGGCNTCHGAPKNNIYVWDIPFNHSEYLKTGVQCQTCHLHVTTGTGNVSREKCLECHVSVPDLFPDTKSMHDEHVFKEDIKCFKCHGDIKHGKIEMYDVFSPACQGCHGNRHSVQEEVYSGTGGTDVPVIPDPMFLSNVTCEGCHTSLGRPNTATASLVPAGLSFAQRVAADMSCSTCHGGGYDKLLRLWQSNVRTRIQKLELQESRNLLFTGKSDASNENLSLIKTDGSFGAHNNRYINLLLDKAEKQLRVAEKKPGIEFLYEKNSACLTCHFGIENVSVEVRGETFPHGPHLFSRRCVDCHTNTSPTAKGHGQLTVKADSCSNCHHLAKSNKCETCHSIQADFYNGKFLAATQDTMAASGIACSDCHLAEGEHPSIPSAQVCSTCHDQSTAKEFEDQTKQVKNVISRWERIFPQMVVIYQTTENKGALDTLKSLDVELNKLQEEGSFGAHNPAYTRHLIHRAADFLNGFKN